MANSTFLTKTVEPFVVTWVSERIGHILRPRKVFVGQNTDGSSVHFIFDGVSEDMKTGLLVSTSLTLKPGGVRKLHVDACVLLQAGFERRIMACKFQTVTTVPGALAQGAGLRTAAHTGLSMVNASCRASSSMPL